MIIRVPQRGEIRNLGAYKQAKLIDHSGLCGCFARPTITPTDVDFLVEQDCRFLVGEFKHRDANPSRGQRRAIEELVYALRGRATAFIAFHLFSEGEIIDARATEVAEVIIYTGQVESLRLNPTYLFDLCREWSTSQWQFMGFVRQNQQK